MRPSRTAAALPATWWIGPATTPADLAARLRSRGLTEAEPEFGMVVDVDGLPPPAGDVEEVGEARSRRMARGDGPLVRLVRPARDRGLERALPRWRSATPSRRGGTCVVRDGGGAAVACASLFPAGETGFVTNVGTVPEARGAGHGTSATLAVLAIARRLGYRQGEPDRIGHGSRRLRPDRVPRGCPARTLRLGRHMMSRARLTNPPTSRPEVAMASVNPLLELWRSGKPSLGGWLTTADPQIVEYLASCGFDEVCIDQQHGLADGALLAGCFRAIELHGAAPTTRVPANDFAEIGHALDVGAVAIVVPMVGTAEEAAHAAAACHYPPRGGRSVGPLRGLAGARIEASRGARRGRLRRDDRDPRGSAPTSTPSPPRPVSTRSTSVRATSVSGSGCRPGPRTGRPTRRRPIAEAIATILAACRQHGVTPGIHTGDGATARRYLDQGFLYLTVANELGLITIGGRAELAIARGTVASADAAVI